MKQYNVLIDNWVSFFSSLLPSLFLPPLARFDQNFLERGLAMTLNERDCRYWNKRYNKARKCKS